MRQSSLKIELLVGIFFIPILFLGCTKEKRHASEETSVFNPMGATNLASIHSDIILLSCAVSGCHDNRATPAAGLNLTSAANMYNAFVNKNSAQVPSLKYVLPNGPDFSYLVNKLDGTHLTVGGTGVRMPQYAAALDQIDRDRIVQWIIDGAQNN